MPTQEQIKPPKIEEEKIKLSPEQEKALEKFISLLKNGRIDSALEIKNTLNLPEDVVKSAAKEGFISLLKNGWIESAFEIKNTLNLPEDVVQSAAKEEFISLLKNGRIYYVLEIKNTLNLPEEFIDSPEVQSAAKEGFISLIKNGRIDSAIEIKNTLNLPEEFIDSPEVQSAAREAKKQALDSGDISVAIKINTVFNLGDKTLDRVVGDFGDFANADIYETYKQLDGGNISESLKRIGVKHAGEAGKNELRRGLRSLEDKFFKSSADETIILENSIVKADIKRMIRYEDSEWGEHDEGDFDNTVKTYIDSKDEIRPLPEEYEDSKVLLVLKIDKEAQEEFKHTEAFLTKYGTLLQSVKEAWRLIDNADELKDVLETMKEKREHLLAKMEKELERQTNPKAKENLLKRKELLQSANFESIDDPQRMFSDLLSFRGTFDEELRELVFYASFKLNPKTRDMDFGDFQARKPSMEQLSQILNFINRITNQKTLKKYFTDKEVSKKFQGLVNVSALEQEMARWQNQRIIKETMPLQFSPHRDLLTEFSGHIAGACWVSKYDSILGEFPNFISLIMVKNPESEKDRRLAGASLLIETESKNNEPLLVIRGLNPQENIIKQLSVEDFYGQLVDYLKPIAKKQGRKLAITIDDHSGGSGTNRPTLFAFLDELRDKLKKVYLKSDKDTNFNGYNIRNDVYLVE